MLQCHFILASLLVLNGCFFEASCQTVYTYTTKDAQSLPCNITEQTSLATWAEVVVGNPPIRVLTYQTGTVTKSTEEKYENFHYTLEPTLFNLDILKVEEDDGGVYICTTDVGGASYDIMVEVLVEPTVQYESQDVDVLDVIVGTTYDLTCSATGARSNSDLSFVWDPLLVEKTPLIITSKGEYKDYSITSTYTAVRGDSSITCQLTGYAMQDEINDQRMENISHTVNLNVQYAPVCSLVIPEEEDCTEVTLTCECDAVPDITQYSFSNESSKIYEGPSKMFSVSVAYETSTGFSCSATNDIGSGEKSDVKVHDCEKGTTALPTTTIVTTAPLSTNEPTSTKATESTTEELKPNPTNEPGGLTTGAKIGISLGAVAVVVVIVVVAVILWKNGEDDSKPSDSSVADGNVTATNVNITSSEPPAPVYGVVKKDSKKKSDKPDDNGAGPAVVTEPPTYGKIDKNRTKDPTPAPRSSMRDSKNPSNPKQDGPMEMQYADLDHGNKPPSDEVRKPKEEPTEYATVQSVIV